MAPVLLLVLPIVSILLAVSKPRMNIIGLGRAPHDALNIDRCHAIPGLEACEDAWIHHDLGLAYLLSRLPPLPQPTESTLLTRVSVTVPLST